MKVGDILICKREFVWFGKIIAEIGTECKIEYISEIGSIYTDLKNYYNPFITEYKFINDEDFYLLSDYFHTKEELRILKLESL